MDLNLRQAILNNMSGQNQDQIRETIVDAIQSAEEKMLPGLGVLFELTWNQASAAKKEEMITHIEEGLRSV